MAEKLKIPEIKNPVEKLQSEVLSNTLNFNALKNLFVVIGKIGESGTKKFLKELRSEN